MDKNKIIGKEVWVLEEKNYSWKPNKEKTWKVKEYIDWGDERLNGDYCPHVILEDAKGNTKDIREYEVVVIPNTKLPEVDMVRDYLDKNRCYVDEVYHLNKNLCVHIDWGDWKHSFMWLDNLMGYIGYKCQSQEVTEENGSDCYSATHYFYKSVA